MRSSLLVRILGFPATLIHGPPSTLDRWRWLKSRLPRTRNNEKLIDIGCGTGAYTIGAALRGYNSLGLSWSDEGNSVARERAEICKATTAAFDTLDVRLLDSRDDLVGEFDVVICSENIEHIIDDRKLMIDMANCLKPGGRLLLSTPNYHCRAVTPEGNGPFLQVEDGAHVRRGYTPAMLEELCREAGLVCEEFSYCSGFISQKLFTLNYYLGKIHWFLGWIVLLPLRPLTLLLDKIITRMTGWPSYSICLEAYKPRFGEQD